MSCYQSVGSQKNLQLVTMGGMLLSQRSMDRGYGRWRDRRPAGVDSTLLDKKYYPNLVNVLTCSEAFYFIVKERTQDSVALNHKKNSQDRR